MKNIGDIFLKANPKIFLERILIFLTILKIAIDCKSTVQLDRSNAILFIKYQVNPSVQVLDMQYTTINKTA